MDTFTGQGRFTFGSVGLMSGIHFVAIMSGIFGVSELVLAGWIAVMILGQTDLPAMIRSWLVDRKTGREGS